MNGKRPSLHKRAGTGQECLEFLHFLRQQIGTTYIFPCDPVYAWFRKMSRPKAVDVDQAKQIVRLEGRYCLRGKFSILPDPFGMTNITGIFFRPTPIARQPAEYVQILICQSKVSPYQANLDQALKHAGTSSPLGKCQPFHRISFRKADIPDHIMEITQQATHIISPVPGNQKALRPFLVIMKQPVT